MSPHSFISLPPPPLTRDVRFPEGRPQGQGRQGEEGPRTQEAEGRGRSPSIYARDPRKPYRRGLNASLQRACSLNE